MTGTISCIHSGYIMQTTQRPRIQFAHKHVSSGGGYQLPMPPTPQFFTSLEYCKYISKLNLYTWLMIFKDLLLHHNIQSSTSRTAVHQLEFERDAYNISVLLVLTLQYTCFVPVVHYQTDINLYYHNKHIYSFVLPSSYHKTTEMY